MSETLESLSPPLRQSVANLIALRRPDKAALYLASAPSGLDVASYSEQIRAANRFWRRQLGLLEVDTQHARSCLMDECDLTDWLRHFRESVLPVIIEYGLPVN